MGCTLRHPQIEHRGAIARPSEHMGLASYLRALGAPRAAPQLLAAPRADVTVPCAHSAPTCLMQPRRGALTCYRDKRARK